MIQVDPLVGAEVFWGRLEFVIVEVGAVELGIDVLIIDDVIGMLELDITVEFGGAVDSGPDEVDCTLWVEDICEVGIEYEVLIFEMLTLDLGSSGSWGSFPSPTGGMTGGTSTPPTTIGISGMKGRWPPLFDVPFACEPTVPLADRCIPPLPMAEVLLGTVEVVPFIRGAIVLLADEDIPPVPRGTELLLGIVELDLVISFEVVAPGMEAEDVMPVFKGTLVE